MQESYLVFAWGLNVLVVSFVLALFEILLEKNNGWASKLNPCGWGKKVLEGNIVSRICEKPFLTVYHIFIFLIVVPSALAAEYLAVKWSGIGTSVYLGALGRPRSCLVMQVGNARVMPLLYAASVWFGIVFVEDFLWFRMNWHYPKSMQDLLSGKIWWHTQWITLGSIKLPRFYISSFLAAMALLFASSYWSI